MAHITIRGSKEEATAVVQHLENCGAECDTPYEREPEVFVLEAQLRLYTEEEISIARGNFKKVGHNAYVPVHFVVG